jgi:hypothetical protein
LKGHVTVTLLQHGVSCGMSTEEGELTYLNIADDNTTDGANKVVYHLLEGKDVKNQM